MFQENLAVLDITFPEIELPDIENHKVVDSPSAVNVNKIKCYLPCDLPGVGKMRKICILNPFLGKVCL